MFVDTSGWASFVIPSQPFHALAVQLTNAFLQTNRKAVTTNYVLAELTALLIRPLRMPKSQQIAVLHDLRHDPAIEVIPIDNALEAAAWRLWESRADKDWTFVDCSSFAVMQSRGLGEALTSDRHFEQAGFVRLLK